MAAIKYPEKARSSARGSRNGFTKYLGNILDDTKELFDDILDRTGEIEDDARKTARRLTSVGEPQKGDRAVGRSGSEESQGAEIRLRLEEISVALQDLTELLRAGDTASRDAAERDRNDAATP